VTVLKDAIAQIKAKKYLVQSATGYIDKSTDALYNLDKAVNSCKIFTGKEANELEFNKYFDNIITKDNPCQVCAKGAMFLSTIRKFNNFTLQDATTKDLNELAGDKNGTYKIFGEENADKMEEYFERNDSELEDENGEGIDKQWSDDYCKDDNRLIAIFKNAIKNRGTFKP